LAGPALVAVLLVNVLVLDGMAISSFMPTQFLEKTP